MAKEKVSVVMPTFNRAKMFSKAIKSVFDQRFARMDFDIEMIIIDDGSTDNTLHRIKQIVTEYSIDKNLVKYYKFNNNQGIPRALNKGYEMCEGDYVCQLSSDDWWDHDKIHKQLKYLNENPNTGMVYSNYIFVDLDDNGKQRNCDVFNSTKSGIEKKKEMCDKMFHDCYANACTFLMRKEFKNQIGTYPLRPEFEWNQDLFFNFQCIFNQNYEIGFMKEYLAYITIHSQQASKQGKCGLGNHILLPEMLQQAKSMGLM
jgi:glycosyltransferase involved in cell wall biosynthesis